MTDREITPLRESIARFDAQYQRDGLSAQRRYPNESLIQFLASNYSRVPVEARGAIRLLDLGCGSGANLWMMAKEGFEAVGVDSSAVGVALAREHLRSKWGVQAELHVASFLTLPFPSGSFDVVVDIVSLQHLCLSDSQLALTEVSRILKMGGKFFSYRLSDRSVMFEPESGRRLDAVTLENISDPAMPLANNGPTSFWSPQLAGTMYRQAGLEIGSIDRLGRTYSDGTYVEYLALSAARTGNSLVSS